MKLGEQLDRVLLSWRIVAEGLFGQIPYFFDAALAIHERYEVVGRRAELMRAAGRLVAEYIAGLAAVHMFVDLGMTAERGPQIRDAIPKGAE